MTQRIHQPGCWHVVRRDGAVVGEGGDQLVLQPGAEAEWFETLQERDQADGLEVYRLKYRIDELVQSVEALKSETVYSIYRDDVRRWLAIHPTDTGEVAYDPTEFPGLHISATGRGITMHEAAMAIKGVIDTALQREETRLANMATANDMREQ